MTVEKENHPLHLQPSIQVTMSRADKIARASTADSWTKDKYAWCL